MSSILIAYFSRPGENYLGGRIVDLPVGNTEQAARTLADLTGGLLYRIRPLKDYPAGYTACTRAAQAELRAGARPPLAGDPAGLAGFDTLLLAYPNWWGTMPMPVWTFLEQCHTAGKTILPLCTNEGSGMGSSEADLRRLCPGARVLPGLPLPGGAAAGCAPQLRRWLEQNGVL